MSEEDINFPLSGADGSLKLEEEDSNSSDPQDFVSRQNVLSEINLSDPVISAHTRLNFSEDSPVPNPHSISSYQNAVRTSGQSRIPNISNLRIPLPAIQDIAAPLQLDSVGLTPGRIYTVSPSGSSPSVTSDIRTLPGYAEFFSSTPTMFNPAGVTLSSESDNSTNLCVFGSPYHENYFEESFSQLIDLHSQTVDLLIPFSVQSTSRTAASTTTFTIQVNDLPLSDFSANISSASSISENVSCAASNLSENIPLDHNLLLINAEEALPVNIPLENIDLEEAADNSSEDTTESESAPYYQNVNSCLEPDRFFVYSDQVMPQAGKVFRFFISEIHRNSVATTQEFLEVYVTNPIGNVCKARVERDINVQGRSRHICSFRPANCGEYTVRVVMDSDNEQDISGSPFTIFVSRNYEAPQRDVTTFGNGSDISMTNISPELCKGWGICTNDNLNVIYVAERDSNEIWIFDLFGQIVEKFGKSNNSLKRMNRPTGIAFDYYRNRIVVTDQENNRVCFFSISGHYIDSFGTKGHKNGQFIQPWGISVSPCGSFIAVADSKNFRVQVFDHLGNFLQKYGAVDNQDKNIIFYDPRGVCYHKEDKTLFVTDYANNKIFEFDEDLSIKRSISPPDSFHGPSGLAMDNLGNIVVCSSLDNSINVLNPDGVNIKVIKNVDNQIFHYPQDIAIMENGQVVVMDCNGVARIF